MHSMVFDLCAVITNVNINSKLSERSRCNMAMHLLVLNHIRLRHKLIKRNSVITKFYLLACTEAGIEATAWARVGWKCGAGLRGGSRTRSTPKVSRRQCRRFIPCLPLGYDSSRLRAQRRRRAANVWSVADDAHWPPVLWSQTCWLRKLQSKLERPQQRRVPRRPQNRRRSPSLKGKGNVFYMAT